MNSMKRQNDRIPKEELPRSLGTQYATGDQWRSNQSILKEITLNVHWKDWYWSWSFSTLAPEVKSWLIGKDRETEKDWRQEEKERMRWLDGITSLMDMSLSKLRDIVKDREAWHATVHGVTKNLTWLSDWTNKQKFPKVPRAAHFPLISFNEVVS